MPSCWSTSVTRTCSRRPGLISEQGCEGARVRRCGGAKVRGAKCEGAKVSSQMAMRLTAVVLMGIVVLPHTIAGQGMFRRDTPKGPGAPTWHARRAQLPPFTPARTADGQPNL